jgi:hypothetical protein
MRIKNGLILGLCLVVLAGRAQETFGYVHCGSTGC